MKDGREQRGEKLTEPTDDSHFSPTRGRCHLAVCISATHYCGLTGAHVPPRMQNANRESQEREREREVPSRFDLEIEFANKSCPHMGQMVGFLPLFGFYDR